MYDSSKDLLDALRATPSLLKALLHECTQEQARTARGGDEGWSVVEVVCHLRDAEERALERMRSMRDTASPHLAAYDQERWVRECNYAAADLREALAAFIHFRRQHIAELEALPADQWERIGQHEEQGNISIGSHTLHIVSHDMIHAAQIARQLHGVTTFTS
jgi:phytoene dehydrogenase-like protein